MKTDKNVKIVAISLPLPLIKLADEKAAICFQNRREYIKNLILLDLGLITVNKQEGAKKWDTFKMEEFTLPGARATGAWSANFQKQNPKGARNERTRNRFAADDQRRGHGVLQNKRPARLAAIPAVAQDTARENRRQKILPPRHPRTRVAQGAGGRRPQAL